MRTPHDPDEWIKPSGAAGLLSTVDDYLAFARLLLNGGLHQGERLLSEESVALTANHLTAEQIASGGPVLAGHGWGFGVQVVTEPDDVSPGSWTLRLGRRLRDIVVQPST